MSATSEHETEDSFLESADHPEYAIRDGLFRWWLAWCTEDGDWYAVRPFSEDDGPRSDAPDAYRPVGPMPLESVELPWRAVALDALDFGAAS